MCGDLAADGERGSGWEDAQGKGKRYHSGRERERPHGGREEGRREGRATKERGEGERATKREMLVLDRVTRNRYLRSPSI